MFTQLPVPTPFQVGPVNAYLTGRTLVDPGPDSEEAWSHLLDELDERDLVPSDIEHVLVTHPHPDHFGLAARFREAGAEVVSSPGAATIMSDFPAQFERERAFFTDFFERCGMAASTADTVTDLPEAYLQYGPSVTTDREIGDGDSLAIAGTTFTGRAVRGHAEGELIFRYEHDKKHCALVGDHVLAEITPNPLLLPPTEPGGERPRVLPAFNESLRELRAADFDRFLPGHRGILDAPSQRVGEILDAHEERTENVRELIDGPTTPLDVMDGLFGDLPITEYFPGMSEAVGHLDVLEARDEVVCRDRGGVLVYERTQ